MSCGGIICLTVWLHKWNELTIEQNHSALSHTSHDSEVAGVIRLNDMKVLFKSHVYQVLLGIFCCLVTYHCRLTPWSYLTINKTVGTSSEKKTQHSSRAYIALLKTSTIYVVLFKKNQLLFCSLMSHSMQLPPFTLDIFTRSKPLRVAVASGSRNCGSAA